MLSHSSIQGSERRGWGKIIHSLRSCIFPSIHLTPLIMSPEHYAMRGLDISSMIYSLSNDAKINSFLRVFACFPKKNKIFANLICFDDFAFVLVSFSSQICKLSPDLKQINLSTIKTDAKKETTTSH